MRYLTNQYVEALGLQVFPVMKSVSTASWISEHATKPESHMTLGLGLQFEGAIHERHPSGLSWDRAGNDHVRLIGVK